MRGGHEKFEDGLFTVILWVGIPLIMLVKDKNNTSLTAACSILTLTVLSPLVGVGVGMLFFVLVPYLMLNCRSDE